MDEEEVLPGWVKHVSRRKNLTYYYNIHTKESLWEEQFQLLKLKEELAEHGVSGQGPGMGAEDRVPQRCQGRPAGGLPHADGQLGGLRLPQQHIVPLPQQHIVPQTARVNEENLNHRRKPSPLVSPVGSLNNSQGNIFRTKEHRPEACNTVKENEFSPQFLEEERRIKKEIEFLKKSMPDQLGFFNYGKLPQWICPKKDCGIQNKGWYPSCFVCWTKKLHPNGHEVEWAEPLRNQNASLQNGAGPFSVHPDRPSTSNLHQDYRDKTKRPLLPLPSISARQPTISYGGDRGSQQWREGMPPPMRGECNPGESHSSSHTAAPHGAHIAHPLRSMVQERIPNNPWNKNKMDSVDNSRRSTSPNKPSDMYSYQQQQYSADNWRSMSPTNKRPERRNPKLQGERDNTSNEPENHLFERRKNLKRKNGELAPVQEPKLKEPQFKEPQFDLRMKLTAQKKSKPMSIGSSSSHTVMEWEDNTGDRVQSQTIPKKSKDDSFSTSKFANLKPYKKIYLVCDTSAFLHEKCIAEDIIATGYYRGLQNVPIQVVVPYIIYDELDGIKDKTLDDVGFRARNTSRYIKLYTEKNSPSLLLQEGNKSREPVGPIELRTNDDLVLNCCLQMRDRCKEGEIAILMTTDNNLAIKAFAHKMKIHDWNSFIKWTRQLRCEWQQNSGYSSSNLQTQNNQEFHLPGSLTVQHCNRCDEPMDIDYFTDRENLVPQSKQTPQAEDSTENKTLPMVENCIHSHFEELKVEFQNMLHGVLEEAIKVEYQSLEHHANNIKPDWSLLTYVTEINKRTFIILPNSKIQDQRHFKSILAKLIKTIKKYNSGDKEVFTIDDVNQMFDLCGTLPKLLASRYAKHTTIFLTRLKVLKEEWKEASNTLTNTSPTQSVLPDVNGPALEPASLAIQNCLNCLEAEYAIWKTKLREDGINKDSATPLRLYCQAAVFTAKMLDSVLQESFDNLTSQNENIRKLHLLITNGVRDDELGTDNVVKVLSNLAYRETLNETLVKFQDLSKRVALLMSEFGTD